MSLSSNKIIDLNKLVHLALHSPRIGIVNFNILKTFLIELLKALNLQSYEPKFDDPSSRQMFQLIQKLTEQQNDNVIIEEKDAGGGGGGNEHDTTGYGSDLIDVSVDGGRFGVASSKGFLSLEQKPLTERLHNLEDKLQRLEQQINAYNAMPPNNAVLEKAKKSTSSQGPIVEMWQYTQLSKRLESNEDGITKLSSLMQDLISDLNGVRDVQMRYSEDIPRLNDFYHSLMDKIKDLEELQSQLATREETAELARELENANHKLRNLNESRLADYDKFEKEREKDKEREKEREKELERERERARSQASSSIVDRPTVKNAVDRDELDGLIEQLRDLERKLDDKLSDSVGKGLTLDDLGDFVTWPALEKSLKGIRELIDSMSESFNKSGSQNYTTHHGGHTPTGETVLRRSGSLMDHNSRRQRNDSALDVNFNPDYESQALAQTPALPPSTPAIAPTGAVRTHSRPTSAHPSEQVHDILSKLGTLNSRHEQLKAIVEGLKRELSDKSKSPTLVRLENFASSSIPQFGYSSLPPIVDTDRLKSGNIAKDNALSTISESDKPRSAITASDDVHTSRPGTGHHENNVATAAQSQAHTKLSDDFTSKIEEVTKIKSELDALRGTLNKESNKRQHIEQMSSNLNTEIEKLKFTIKDSLDNNRLNKEDIAALQEAIRILDEKKADKDWLRYEFDKKADKRDLDNKIHRKTFEDTCNEISNSINNAVQKSAAFENEMRKGTSSLYKELESKVDRFELEPLKEYIEKQLKKIKKLQKEAQGTTQPSEEDAAGMRKQLLRFHCLSCDRPIVAIPQNPFPSLPNEKGMRPIQSPRPFTTFELEQIRQFQRSGKTKQLAPYSQKFEFDRCLAKYKVNEYKRYRQFCLKNKYDKKYLDLFKKWHYTPQAVKTTTSRENTMYDSSGYDLFSTVRQCGGAHTLTLPHKKIVKVPQQIVEEVPVVPPVIVAPTAKSEVQIQGQDGHIYKGRIDTKLVVEMKKSTSKSSTSFSQIVNGNPNSNNDNRPMSTAANNNNKDGNNSQSPNNDKMQVVSN